MKKIQLGLIISLALVLVGCKRPVAAKEATEEFVNGLIYQQEPEKIKATFSFEGQVDDLTQSTRLADLKEAVDLDAQLQLEGLSEKETKTLIDKTSFKVKVIEETRGRAKLEVAIIGLEELNDEQLTAILEAELEKKTAHLTAETSDEQINQLINEISIEVLGVAIGNQQAKKEPKTVKLELMADPEDKSKWVIQNKDAFMIELADAFGY